jgi:RNA polymerase sigma-70 factor (ECF subfamily)
VSLLSLLPARARVADDTFACRLEAFVARARAGHPTIAIDDGVFVPWVGERLALDESAASELSNLHAEDLYLACACAHRDARAIASFEERYFPALEAACRSFRALSQAPDDVKQMLRERLFLGTEGDPPKLSV